MIGDVKSLRRHCSFLSVLRRGKEDGSALSVALLAGLISAVFLRASTAYR